MRKITSYALQYMDASFDELKASGYDLLILQQENIHLSKAQLASLTNNKIVAAYVNSSVTDHYIPYWNKSWTDNGLDTGKAIKGNAPAWLLNQPANDFGIVADFSNSQWRRIVTKQAEDLIKLGYNGIFLDDISSAYFLFSKGKGTIKNLSKAMIKVVLEVKKAIQKINPKAILIVNGDPYLVANVGGKATLEARQFLDTIDAMLLESHYSSPAVYKVAIETVQPFAQLLALEFNKSNAEAKAFKTTTYTHNIIPYLSPTDAYNTLVPLEKKGFWQKLIK